jgi:homoserine O-succinyltransferase/O-acetyltransferase
VTAIIDRGPGESIEPDAPEARAEPRRLEVGLVNNMPDSALRAAERQFHELLDASGLPVRLRLYALPSVARSPAGEAQLAHGYRGLKELLETPLDALIITGAEPKAPRLEQSPYWDDLVEVLNWAERERISTLWSCLAAHAAALYLDGIERVPLTTKHSGVFDHVIANHALTAELGERMAVPHSRWNDLPGAALTGAGYSLLAHSEAAGVLICARRDRALRILVQGHPEYETRTLLKEYQRDIGRYLRGEQAQYPTAPTGYFTAAAQAHLEEFRARAESGRDPELIAEFPYTSLASGLRNRWRQQARTLYRNWLADILAARAVA